MWSTRQKFKKRRSPKLTNYEVTNLEHSLFWVELADFWQDTMQSKTSGFCRHRFEKDTGLLLHCCRLNELFRGPFLCQTPHDIFLHSAAIFFRLCPVLWSGWRLQDRKIKDPFQAPNRENFRKQELLGKEAPKRIASGSKRLHTTEPYTKVVPSGSRFVSWYSPRNWWKISRWEPVFGVWPLAPSKPIL